MVNYTSLTIKKLNIMKFMKYISYIGYVLLAVSAIIFIAFLATSNFSQEEFPLADLVLNWTYSMIAIASVVAVILPLINMAKNPKAMIRTLIGVGAVGLVVLVCYLMADDTAIVTPGKTFDNRSELIISDTGLYATYFAFTVAILTIIGGEVYKLFRR